jgi:hypothetical protein
MELRMFDLSISLSKVSVKFQKKMGRKACANRAVVCD